MRLQPRHVEKFWECSSINIEKKWMEKNLKNMRRLSNQFLPGFLLCANFKVADDWRWFLQPTDCTAAVASNLFNCLLLGIGNGSIFLPIYQINKLQLYRLKCICIVYEFTLITIYITCGQNWFNFYQTYMVNLEIYNILELSWKGRLCFN